MIGVLVEHSSHVFSQLPAVEKQFERPRDRKEQFLDQLPLTFTRLEYVQLAKSLSISERTAEAYIMNFCDKGLIVRQQRGIYTRLSSESI
jgi:hypothetical protein